MHHSLSFSKLHSIKNVCWWHWPWHNCFASKHWHNDKDKKNMQRPIWHPLSNQVLFSAFQPPWRRQKKSTQRWDVKGVIGCLKANKSPRDLVNSRNSLLEKVWRAPTRHIFLITAYKITVTPKTSLSLLCRRLRQWICSSRSMDSSSRCRVYLY